MNRTEAMRDARDRAVLPAAHGGISESLRQRAAGLRLPSSRDAAARHAGIRVLPPVPGARDLDGIVRCSCDIFGSSEVAQDGAAIWGEGWQCDWCGVKRPAAADGPCAACGSSERTAVYGVEEMRRSFGRTLRPRADWQPAGCVLEHEGIVRGYAFGAVTTARHAAAQMREKLAVDYRFELKALGVDVKQLDLEAAMPRGFPVLYMEELCIELGARNGMASLHGIVSTYLALAAELGARSVTGFTTKRSAAFRLIDLFGGEVALAFGDFVVFRSEDFVPLATLLHHLTPEHLLEALTEQPPRTP